MLHCVHSCCSSITQGENCWHLNMSLFIWFQLEKGGCWEVDEKWQMKGEKINNGSLQAGCVKPHISCTCIITANNYAQLFSCLQEQRWVRFSTEKAPLKKMSMWMLLFLWKVYTRLTAALLKLVGVDQNEPKLFHISCAIHTNVSWCAAAHFWSLLLQEQ